MTRWMLGLFFLGGCQDQPLPRGEFNGEAALAYVVHQVDFGPRIPGTPPHRAMGDWLDSLLRVRADTVIVQSWNHGTATGDTIPLRNFVARFQPGATQRILLLAHWDTRPRSDALGGSDTIPVPGANDGGSGVAVLLGVADVLRGAPPTIGVDLLFVDGEDYGTFPDTDVLLGSKYYAANPAPGPAPLFAILFDMVGDRNLQIYQEGYSLTGAPEVVEQVWSVASQLGYDTVFIAQPKHSLTDDHIPLQNAGIRAIDVIDFDYPHWHTPEDTPDKLSARSLGMVGDVAIALIRTLK